MKTADHSPTESDINAALRRLPAVDHLCQQPAIANLLDEFPRSELLTTIRQTLDECRAAFRDGREAATDVSSLALAIRQKLYQRARPNLRPVINATGIVLHTGLGRAPLAQEAVDAIAQVAGGYCNLEFELETGERGDRHRNLRELLRELTGAEDAIVVNNNAAATLLALNTAAAGREVVVSRGQLVEIGGSYRIPDIMAAAGCRMVEVGTTNRTHIGDYERAITADTRAFARVHTSNYRIQGFVTTPALEALVELAQAHPVPDIVVIDDLGSGLLLPQLPWPEAESDAGTPAPAAWDEPSVRHSVAAGAHLTLFSGDKLLGGPQAGVIVGQGEWIGRLRKNPLMRTYRPDKLTLAGLEATLRLYRDPASLHRKLPVYRMLAAPPDALRETARRIETQISQLVPQASVTSRRDESFAGGGSLPTIPFPTWVVRVTHPDLSGGELAAALRARDLPVIVRVQEDALVFDCRTLRENDAEQIPTILADVVRELSTGAGEAGADA